MIIKLESWNWQILQFASILLQSGLPELYWISNRYRSLCGQAPLSSLHSLYSFPRYSCTKRWLAGSWDDGLPDMKSLVVAPCLPPCRWVVLRSVVIWYCLLVNTPNTSHCPSLSLSTGHWLHCQFQIQFLKIPQNLRLKTLSRVPSIYLVYFNIICFVLLIASGVYSLYHWGLSV